MALVELVMAMLGLAICSEPDEPGLPCMPAKVPPTEGSLWAEAVAANMINPSVGIRDLIFIVVWGLSRGVIVRQ